MSAKKIWATVISVLILVGLVATTLYVINTKTTAKHLSTLETEEFLNSVFDNMAISSSTKKIAEKNHISVNEVSYGSEKNIIVKCSVETIDLHSVLAPSYNDFLSSDVKKKTRFKSALDFKLEFEPAILELIANAPVIKNDCIVTIFDTDTGLSVYADNVTIDAVYGGLKTAESEISLITTYTDSTGAVQEIQSGNVNKGLLQCLELRYNSSKPDTSNAIGRAWNSFKYDFYRNFIEKDRWVTIFEGLWMTIKLTFCALIIGIILGFLVAFVRCTYLKNTKRSILLKILNAISQVYLSVIRGTPAVVQITIIYFVIFMPMGVDKFLSAVICFGVNSGAYVAEIVRGGIMSIDEGQTEAGRSLGFGYMQTMYHIVFPQAFKAVLPALANEFVVLLKETSIAFYIGLGDIMYAVNAIRAATYTPFMPLLAAALIYLVMVLVLSKLVGLLERRLRNNER